MDYITKIEDALGLSSLNELPPVRTLAAKLKTKPEHVSLALALLLSVFLTLTCTGNYLLMAFFTFLVPAYSSLKLLAPGAGAPEDFRKWLTYWISFALVLLCKPLLNKILFFFPFKTLVLTALLTALYAPQTNGHEIVYNKILRPLYGQYERSCGQLLEMAGDDVKLKGEQKGKKNK